MPKYHVPNLATFQWQKSVKDKDLGTPPGSPTKGDRHILPASGLTGAWVSHENEIAQYDGSVWEFFPQVAGAITHVQDEDKDYQFLSTVLYDLGVEYSTSTSPSLFKGAALAIDRNDSSIWYYNNNNNFNSIHHVTSTGGAITNFPTNSYSLYASADIRDLAVANDGSVFIVHGAAAGNKIWHLNSSGGVLNSFLRSSTLGVAVDRNDSSILWTYNSNNTISTINASTGTGISNVSIPVGSQISSGFCQDSLGNFWGITSNTVTIRNFSPTGVLINSFNPTTTKSLLGIQEDDLLIAMITSGTIERIGGGVGVTEWVILTDQNTFDDKTVNPTVNDDSSLGYTLGSRWINITTDQEFTCLDNTIGAAVWQSSTQVFDTDLENLLIFS